MTLKTDNTFQNFKIPTLRWVSLNEGIISSKRLQTLGELLGTGVLN